MNTPHLTLMVLTDKLAVCRLKPDSAIPAWATNATFSSITRTPDELSIVCRESDAPEGITCEKGWRCLQVQGPLDFAQTGILASLATSLAEAGISIFAVSTFNTDYVLVKQDDLMRAIEALTVAGLHVRKPYPSGETSNET